jgi:shikimate kinase
MDRSIIYLVGFMGAGKTSVGRRVSEMLGWSFVDLDQKIEETAGESIRELFRREGEAYFRGLEGTELQRVSRQERTVVALGGGAFCSAENQRVIQTTGASVWLDAPIDLLFSRCSGDSTRPLFTNRQEMEELLERRRPHYEKANLHLKVAGLSVEEIAQKVVADLKAELTAEAQRHREKI